MWRNFRRWIVVVALGLGFASPSAAVRNGLLTWDRPAVGAIATGSSPANLEFFSCTGTLIGRHTFLTATHCIVNVATGVPFNDLWVFFQHHGFVPVQSVIPHPDFIGPVFFAPPFNDVGLLRLAEDVVQIPPARVNTPGQTPTFDPPTPLSLFGFGRYGEPAEMGLKMRNEDYVVVVCPDGYPNNLCYNNSLQAVGDSGGPLFIDGDVVAALVSSGFSSLAGGCPGLANCATGPDIASYHDWIVANADEPINRSGQVSEDQVGDIGVEVIEVGEVDFLTLDQVHPQNVFSFNIGVGSGTLYATLNAQGASGFDDTNFDLYVRRGAAFPTCTAGLPDPTSVIPCDPIDPAAVTDWTCEATATGSFEGCPPFSDADLSSGPWNFLVELPASTDLGGDYQLTITAIPTAACSDGMDNDGDGLIDFPQDSGCNDADDVFEQGDCDDGLDNDGDLLIDAGFDPGCGTDSWPTEEPACNDGLDNDGDGFCDVSTSTCTDGSTPGDPGCAQAWELSEADGGSGCGLLGIEPVALLWGVMLARRRLRKR